MRFQLALNKFFCPMLWYCKTKQCFLPPPHRFSTQNSQYHHWKASKYSILMVTELGSPVSESPTESQNLMRPVILNTNFIKQKSKFDYPQDSTKLRNFAGRRWEWKFSIPWGDKRKYSTPPSLLLPLSHSTWLTLEPKR